MWHKCFFAIVDMVSGMQCSILEWTIIAGSTQDLNVTATEGMAGAKVREQDSNRGWR